MSLPAQRQSPAGTEVRLQAGLDRAADHAGEGACRTGRARGAGGGLQYRSDRSRHLQQPVVEAGRPAAARAPRPVRAPAGARVDRRPARAVSRRSATVDLLAVFPPGVGAGRGPEDRSPVAEPGGGGATGGRRRGQGGARSSGRQRPCADLDRAARRQRRAGCLPPATLTGALPRQAFARHRRCRGAIMRLDHGMSPVSCGFAGSTGPDAVTLEPRDGGTTYSSERRRILRRAPKGAGPSSTEAPTE